MKAGASPRGRGFFGRAVLALLLAGAIGALLISARMKQPATADPPSDGIVLRRGNGPEPESLDPHSARSEAALHIAPPQPDYAAWPMPQRIATARELLRSAGVLQSPPVIELRYNGGELHSRIAVAVSRMWKEALGIDVSLHSEEFKVLLQDIDRGDVVQVFRGSWLADYDDAYGFLQILHSGFGINMPHYANADYDALLLDAASEGDADHRRLLLQKAEALMLSEQPLIPLFFYVSKHLLGAQVIGWRDNAMNVVYSKGLAKRHSGLR